ncbi:hypothetical protein [Streptomyces sp. PRh5]|nr:hypothetical protein [Streptomyces sp. PRh5]
MDDLDELFQDFSGAPSGLAVFQHRQCTAYFAFTETVGHGEVVPG